ncbi:MAG: hypothetical protein K0U34_03655, partial [Alphaproteobacteria bacterium]|nr:hypothetical protein [Alphaproteobacteria bacterium]
MGPSDKPLYVVGSALAALLVIVGFKSFLEMKDKGHHGQPEAGYALQESEEEPKAAAAPSVAASSTATAEAVGVDGDASTTAPAAAGTADSTGTAPSGEAGGFAAMVAAADVKKGSKLFRRCGSCHSSKKGDAPSLGPNLYGILGRDIGSQSAFTGYSDAMKAKTGTWTID